MTGAGGRVALAGTAVEPSLFCVVDGHPVDRVADRVADATVRGLSRPG